METHSYLMRWVGCSHGSWGAGGAGHLGPGVCRGLDLQGVQLRRADLEGANLTYTCWVSADLADAVLTRANLTGANLGWALLRGGRFGRMQNWRARRGPRRPPWKGQC